MYLTICKNGTPNVKPNKKEALYLPGYIKTFLAKGYAKFKVRHKVSVKFVDKDLLLTVRFKYA